MKQLNLHQNHLDLGAKMGAFAGFDMPLSYQGVKAEHLCVRKHVGVFDVSHMGEFIVSGNATQVVLIHAPKKKYFDNDPLWGEIPSVASEIDIIEKFGATVIAVALNTSGLSKQEALSYKDSYQKTLDIPVVLPLEEGVKKIVSEIKGLSL